MSKLQLEKLNQEIATLSEALKFLQNKTIETENKIDKKTLPVNLELNILQSVQQSIQKSIGDCLTGYNSPLIQLVQQVVNSRATLLKDIITSAFDQVIKTEEFKQSIVSAFSHKVARTIINNNEGLFDKVSNELRQSPVFKSKMTLAVANVIEECLRKQDVSV